MNICTNDLIFYHSDGRYFKINELRDSEENITYIVFTESGWIRKAGEIREEDMVNLTDRIYEAIDEFFKEKY